MASTASMSLTSIHANLTFSKKDVWAWLYLPVPAEAYTDETSADAFAAQLQNGLAAYSSQHRETVSYHILPTSVQGTADPIVLLGVKIGERSEYSSNKIMPAFVDNFINLLADAPVDDYLSDKELAYWETHGQNACQTLAPLIGAALATSNQIAFTVRKNFYPAMSVPELYATDDTMRVWGENEIASILEARMVNHPKYITIQQEIGGYLVEGHRATIHIVKPNPQDPAPYINLWLSHIKQFPFGIDYSIRVDFHNGKTVNDNQLADSSLKHEYTINVEAGTREELTERVNQLIAWYRDYDVLVSWTTGDHAALLKEGLPNGYNPDIEAKQKKSNELSLTHIYEDITFSKTDVWVWVVLPPTQYEFLDDDTRTHLAQDIDLALANLVTSDEKGIECHMLVTSRPFDSVAWIRDLNERVEKFNPAPYNQEFLYSMYSHVDYQNFREKVVLLGINIGKRTSYAPNKSVSPTLLENVKGVVSAAPVSEEISDKELSYWRQLARQVSVALQLSRIQAQPANATDIAYAIRKNFHPSMPSPTPEELAVGIEDKWGREEVITLADAQIENHPKFLKITQNINGEEITGYRATLCFSKFPEVMHFPQWEPWIHYAGLLPFPVDFSLRFTLEPSRKVRKEVDRKLKEAKDQANNMESAGGNASLEVQEHINLGTELEYALKKDATPWVFGRYRLTIEAETEEELREKAKQVIDHYRGMEIFVTWPTGDQFSLLKENLPNDRVRIPSYYQRQELSIISTGMPSGAGTTGDMIIRTPEGEQRGWIGHYLGYTTGRIQEPVFVSLHSTISANNPGGLVITGSPGGGKTFAALTLTYQMALSNVWTIYIDPKADALAMQYLPGLEGRVKVIDLLNGNEGILDPFSIGKTIPQQMELAIETIALFVGGFDHISDEQNIQLNRAIETVANYPQPTLGAVVDYLMSSPDHSAAALGARLNVIRQLPFAQLCFSANNTGETLNPEQGLTIITLLGLDLPPATLARDSFTNGNRLAVGVMYLLASFTRQLMMNSQKSHPKAIVIDEAWAITATAQGSKLVQEVARMGRSHNTGIVLVSQNAGDFNGDSVTNSVSVKFAFRATQPGEIDDIITFLNLEPSDTNRDSIRNLRNGECLIRDWNGRIARVQVDGWDERFNEAAETNPEARQQTH